MKQKFLTYIWLILFLGGALMPAVGVFAQAPVTALTSAERLDFTKANTALEVIAQDEQSLTLRLQTPQYSLKTAYTNGSSFDQLQVSGAALTQTPGQPQVPFFSALIGIPASGDVALEVLRAPERVLPGNYRLMPADAPAPLTDDLQPGEWQPAYDNTIYGSTTPYPGTLAQVDEPAWLRGQRLVRVAVYPFQYQPASGELTYYPEIHIRLTFDKATAAATAVPAAEDPAFESVLQSSLLNYQQAKNWRGMPPPSTQANTPANSLGERYRIAVTADGLYRVTYADLQAAGMDVDNINPQTFRMTNQGDEVAIEVIGESDASFDPGDEILFYGQAFRGDRMMARYETKMAAWISLCASKGCTIQKLLEKYMPENIYWLQVGGSPGPRITTQSGAPTTAPVAEWYTETVRAEQQNLWWSWHFTGSTDTFFWERVSVGPGATATRTYATTLSNLATEPGLFAAIQGEVVARDGQSLSIPIPPDDHHTRFYINSQATPFQDSYWDGKIRHTFSGTFTQTQLTEGSNSVKFQLVNDAGRSTTSDNVYFDWYEIAYARRFVAQNNQIQFSTAYSGSFQYPLENFADATFYVYDVSDPLAPRRISGVIAGASAPYTATFEGPASTYLAVSQGGVRTPDSLTHYIPPDFFSASNGADYLIISHADFITSVQPLADYYTAQGMRVRVIDVQDIYNEFNDGIYHTIAIRNFLEHAYANWQAPAPSFVLLVGDGTWNLHGTTGFGSTVYDNPPIYMPPNLAFVDPWQGETDSTSLLAMVVGDDLLPDMHIGRLPVNSVTEADNMVNKILGYLAQPFADWQMNLLFVADNIPDSAGDFIYFSEALIQDHVPLPGYNLTRIYLDEGGWYPQFDAIDFECTSASDPDCPAVTSAIADSFNTGALLSNYIGHASINRWTHEQIFMPTHLGLFTNASTLPFNLSMTCLDGFWFHPNQTSANASGPGVMEEFLRDTDGGTIGAFAPTGLGVSTGHDALHRGFYDEIFTHGNWQVGPDTLAAKLELFELGYSQDLLYTFLILGDPALYLHSPHAFSSNATVDTAAADPGQQAVLSVTITNTGHLTDTYALTLTDANWQTALPFTQTLLAPNASVTFPITVTVPMTAAGSVTETFALNVNSLGDIRNRSVQMLTAESNAVYALLFTGELLTGSALPGDAVTYTLTITNLGNAPDTFDLMADADWVVDFPVSVGALAAGASATFEVAVSVPTDALFGTQDSAVITATSQGDAAQQAQVNLTTTALRTYGLLLGVQPSASSALPGEMATFTLTITNTGNAADTFNSAAVTGWALSGLPAQSNALAPGAQQTFTVQVSVPLGALAGDFDVAQVTFVSQDSPSTTAQVSFTSTALPVYGVQAAIAPVAQTGLPGELLTYTLWVTNTGNITDTFDTAVTADFPVSGLPFEIGAIAPGDVVTRTLQVLLPSNALAGDSDTAQIVLTSQAAPQQTAEVEMTSSVGARYGVLAAVIPSAQVGAGGEMLTYQLLVTNTGNTADTFTTALTAVWTVNGLPAQVGPLAAGASAVVPFTVQVPEGALDGEQDVAQIDVTSTGDALVTSSATFTSTVGARYGLALTVETAALQAAPGETVTYTLRLTNTGNAADVFDVAIQSDWMVTAPVNVALDAGESTDVVVRVTLPVNAANGAQTVTDVTVTSSGDAAQTAQVQLTTTCQITVRKVYLPLIVR